MNPKISKSIFTDDFPVIDSGQDLQTLIRKYAEYDSYYVSSGAIRKRRDWFDYLYKRYYPYADGNFLSDLEKHFHQRTWEMYLGCVMLGNNIKIEQPIKDGGPDILFKYQGKKVWIECVACNRGDEADQVPPIKYGVLQSLPVDNMLFRIVQALTDKYDIYRTYAFG